MGADSVSDLMEDAVFIGAVGSKSARLWIRSRVPGPLHITLSECATEEVICSATAYIQVENECDNTLVFTIPDDIDPPPVLRPSNRYRATVARSSDEQNVGEAMFETAPAQGHSPVDSFSIGLMSCHQPFDERGNVRNQARCMLRATMKCLEQNNAKLVFTVGDQMYSDYPRTTSLFVEEGTSGVGSLRDRSPGEILDLYHARYRAYFGLAEWQAIHSRFPCYPILDDHEIVDNWGSDPNHQTSEWRKVADQARTAFLDYQASRVLGELESLPDHFAYQVTYGGVATLVLDLRSERRAGDGARLLSEEQFALLDRFLSEHHESQVLCLVLSVPPVHLPRRAVRIAAAFTRSGSEFADRWSAPAHVKDRDRLLNTLHHHQQKQPHQHVVLLSGDIHIGCAHEIRWSSGARPLIQLVSSGITHDASWLARLASKYSILAKGKLTLLNGATDAAVRPLPPRSALDRNPCTSLNLGLLRFDPRSRTLTFCLFTHEGDEPVCVFESKPFAQD